MEVPEFVTMDLNDLDKEYELYNPLLSVLYNFLELKINNIQNFLQQILLQF